LSEPKLIDVRHFSDLRGSLKKPFVQLGPEGDFEVMDLYVSKSVAGVFRGLHMQVGAYAQAKLVIPLEGEIIDFAVDAREGSLTFGMLKQFDLDASNDLGVYVPRGWAHGFYSKSRSTVLNLSDTKYVPEHEIGINPRSFSAIRSLGKLVLSDKDNSYSHFEVER
jgi:dTDP-4-dehydrorhamnose 3,5-epimerase